jgi:hypothetical protein
MNSKAWLAVGAIIIAAIYAASSSTPPKAAAPTQTTSSTSSWASSTAPAAIIAFETPVVPPLLAGEVPPTDAPNYFDARELGTGSLAAYAACQDGLEQKYPNATDGAVAAVCTCTADLARKHARAGQSAGALSDSEWDKCFMSALNSKGPSPFAAGLSPTTPRIAATFGACFDALPEGYPLTYQGHFCACATDAAPKDAGKAAYDDDIRRCDIAARYAANTGRHLTRRQFSLLGPPSAVRQPSMGQPQATGYAPPVAFQVPQYEGAFIPYPGNGNGPSPCADGMWSNSSGSGACSHHGGLSGGRHRRH